VTNPTQASQNHSDQVAYWNGVGGEHWIAREEETDRFLAGIADIAIDRARPVAGESIVDIGCGCGPTTVELARRVGPAGRVTALDVSAQLLARAKERLAPYPWTAAILADAAAYRFAPGSADLLFSRFGVMFFGDPDAAFANMHRWLKPSGRIVFACWRKPSENPWMMLPLQAAYEHVPKLPKLGPEDPGPFSFGPEERVRRILTNGGFRSLSLEPIDVSLDLAGGRGLDSAVGLSLRLGATSRALEGQPQEKIAAVAASVKDVLAPYAKNGEVRLGATVWVASARAA